MKLFRIVISSLILVLTGVSTPASVVAKTAAEEDLERIRVELESIRSELKDQGKMIRSLYDYVDAEIDLDSQKEKQENEAHLLLEPSIRISDGTLTSQSSANPVAAEFAVITQVGGIQIFDYEGNAINTLKLKKRIITTVAYSPDGQMLLAGTKEGALLIWNRISGACTMAFENVANSVGRIAWLEGTNSVVWASYVKYYGKNGEKINRDKPAVTAFNLSSGRTNWTLMASIRKDYQCMASSPDGKRFVLKELLGQPRGPHILDAVTGDIQSVLYYKARSSGPLSVCFAPDNKTVAAGYAPWDVILWNADDESLLKILEGHSNWVVSLAFSSDTKLLISGAGDSTARIWSIESGAEIGRIRFPGSSTYIHSVGFSPDGNKVYALAEDGLLTIADVPPYGSQVDGEN